MWTSEKQLRFDALRRAEAQGGLSASEQAELAALVAELDGAERDALEPALLRMQQRLAAMQAEKADADAEAAELERIVAEQEGLLADARAYVEELGRRRTVLAERYRRVTGRESAPSR